MLISSLLDLHHDETLPRSERVINDRNIGDAFLYGHHRMYRNLRDAFWALGYRFDTHDFCYFFDVPLFSLDLMLRERKIPIHDTVTPLVDLTRRFAGAELDDLYFDTTLSYPSNHILHHSVHCVSDHVSAALIGSQETLGKSPLSVLRILTCESFANAIDLLANIESHRFDEAGRALFIINNLVSKSAEECAPYGELIARLGLKTATQIIALFFLFRNLLGEEIDPAFLGRALRCFGIESTAAAEELIPLFDRTNLGFGFRINTTTRYFRYLGYEFEDLLELYEFDLLELAGSHAGVAQTFDVVAELIANSSGEVR